MARVSLGAHNIFRFGTSMLACGAGNPTKQEIVPKTGNRKPAVGSQKIGIRKVRIASPDLPPA
jgi:hypothetical protein